MSQLVPSTVFASQAVKLLNDLSEAQTTGASKDYEEIIAEISNLLSNFEDNLGQPLVRFDPVVHGEPPNSFKANRFWSSVEHDVNTMQQQIDVLRASALFTHNLVKTEILKARNDTSRLNNKVKSLQLYSENPNPNVVIFGDFFDNLEFADLDLIPQSERLSLFSEGQLTLSKRGPLKNLSAEADFRVLDGSSNGVLGNNQEVIEEEVPNVDVPGETTTQIVFKAEGDLRNDLLSITDDDPTTWVEYERYEVSPIDYNRANGYNFSYLSGDDESEDIDWYRAPEGGLDLALEIDLKSIKPVNVIQLRPYGLEDDKNFPFKVSTILTSANGTDWERVEPPNTFVGSKINLKTARVAEDVAINRAIWTFDTRYIQYVRVFMKQDNPIPANIGHAYWVDQNNEKRREEGPVPPVGDTTKYLNQKKQGKLVQKREVFQGKRWAIGVRDLLVNQVEYQTSGAFISKRIPIGGVVDRVILQQAEFEIPESFDSELSWINFYISPDDGESWHQIGRINDPNLGIPEQISYNDPLPEDVRERGVAYYSSDRDVTSLRVKVEMSRPNNAASSTPVLKSYTLKVLRR